MTFYSARRIFLLLAFASTGIAQADDWSTGGHVKYEINASQYPANNVFALASTTNPVDHFLDFRYKADKSSGKWNYQIHYELLALYGDSAKALATLPSLPGVSLVPSDSTRLFNLSQVFGDSGYLVGVHRIDRLVASYTDNQLVLRFGRQAISWGNGLIFNPMDVVNPFSPTAISKEYKTGEDMVYGQWLYDTGNDLQAILLPRRNMAGAVDDTQSSYAMKYRGAGKRVEYQLMAARHYDEWVTGIGLSADVKGAVWRADLVNTALTGGTQSLSGVVNASYSWMWGKHNVSGNIEFYRNGVGISDGDYSSVFVPASPLAQRLARGEVFALGRDYLAGNLTIEMTPRLVLTPTLIQNLNDHSGILQTVATYDWKQEAPLTFGFSCPYGKQGSEFGGIATTTPGQYYGPGISVFFQVGYYF